MTEAIFQHHYGSGDNVARDKIIQSIQANDFVVVAQELYYLINIGSFEEAKNYLEAINKLAAKSSEVTQLLEIISIYLDAKVNQKKPDNINKIKEIIRLNPIDFKDLYKSMLIEITYLDSKDEALAIYKIYVEESSNYIVNVKYKLFSEEDELKEVFEKQLPVLDDLSLFFLATGLNRVEKREEALIVLSKIEKRNENLELFRIALNFEILSTKLDRPLMYLEKNIVESFFSIASEFIELIKDKKELNQNSLILLTNLVIKSDFSVCNIMDRAVDFIEVIRPISNEVADALELYSEKKIEVKQDVLNKINDLKSLNVEEVISVLNAISLNKIDLKKLKKWISQCGVIEDENNFHKDLLTLVLKSFIFKDKNNIKEFEECFSKLLNHKEKKLRDIQPFFIITLCDNLFSFKKQQFLNTYRLLESVVSKNSVQSKIYLYFLYSLINLEKYESLRSHIENLDDDSIDLDFRIFRARYYDAIKEYGKSKDDYIKILDYYKESLSVWCDYLILSLRSDDVSHTKKILENIPENILKPRAKNIFHFIYLVYKKIDPFYAESLITKLFLTEPDFVASYLCNMHLQLIANKINLVSNINYDNIYDGIIYEIEGERKQKLIVSDEFSHSPHFINVDSKLGSSLNEMEVGEERIEGYQKIKLIERQPSCVTIFQIALKITEQNRHNSSEFTFYPFRVRENLVVEDMQEILKRFAVDDHTEELISNPDLTMYIKGSIFKNYEEFETVLKILQNKGANFCLSNTVGNAVASDALVLDVYSFTYLCLTNNHKALMESGINAFLTQETFDTISAWISKVTDEGFLSIRLAEESLIKTDANTITTYYSSFIHQLNGLLNYAKIISANIIELPDFANEIRDILSPSVFSTLRLSIANDIPWLCLDSALRTIFVKQNDVKVIKLHDFLNFLGNYLDFEDRKTSITQWSNFGLFTVYRYGDLIELARSTDSEDWILLKNLLTDTPLSFSNQEQALNVLLPILKLVVIKYLKKINLVEMHLLESLIYTCLNKCIQSIEGEFREDRLAKVIVEIIDSINFLEYLCKIFSNILGRFAVGHFLNISYTNEKIEILLNE